MVPETTKEEKQTDKQETCTLTLVRGGISDHKLKIYPARHKEEKVWLDTLEGKERMDVISRVIQMHAPRTGIIPKPVAMCKDPRKLDRITLKDEAIPTVFLENYTLEAPPPEDVPEYTPEQLSPVSPDVDKKFKDLESKVSTLTDAVLKLTTAMAASQGQAEAKRGPGRPPRKD